MDVRSLVTSLGFTVAPESSAAFDKIDHSLQHLRHRLEIIAGAEIIRGLFELAERFGGMGEQLESASTAAGLTAEQFQALAFAAAQNGVSQDEMSGGLAKLSRALYEAQKGGKEATEAFAEAGISQAQLMGLHNARDAFLLLSDSVSQMEDPVKRVAVLQSLMGRGSFTLIKFVKQGSQAIQGLEKDAQSMGAVLSNTMVEDLAQGEDALSGFKTVIRAVVAELGARFAPNIIAVTHALGRFWVRNRAIIMSKLDDWFYDVGFAIGATYAAFEILGNTVAEFVRKHPSLVSALVTIGKYLIAMSAGMEVVHLIVSKTWLAFAALKGILELFLTPWRALLFVAGALQTALSGIALRLALLTASRFPALAEVLWAVGTALSALPVTAVAAGLLAIGTALYTAYEMWEGKSFADTKLGRSIQWVLDKLSLVSKYFSQMFPHVSQTLGDAAGAVGAGASGGYDMLKAQASNGAGLVHSIVNRYSAPFTSQSTAMSPTTNMSVAINVNGAQQPQAIAKQISDALAEQHDAVNRRNMAHIQTALVN